MKKLKNCPFCGGMAEIDKYDFNTSEPWYYIYCIECGAQTADTTSLNLAIDSWNTRVEDN